MTDTRDTDGRSLTDDIIGPHAKSDGWTATRDDVQRLLQHDVLHVRVGRRRCAAVKLGRMNFVVMNVDL